MAKNRFKKYIYCILCTVVLLGILWFCHLQHDTTGNAIKLCIPHDSDHIEINLYNAGDGQYCAFIPSYAELEYVFLAVSPRQRFALDGITLYNGISCGQFKFAHTYELTKNGKPAGTLTFYQSPNIATMYIETASGHMGYIHTNKKNEEDASITLYTVDGRVNFQDGFSKLGGRGNTTWSLAKKPYEVTLSHSTSLLDMAASNKWVLLANGYDETHLRNKIIYNFADAVSTNYTLSPDCTYVETYFNGEFGGLYLLCQEINADTDELALEAEDYYFEFISAVYFSNIPTAFNICSTRAVDVKFPDNVSEEHLDHLKEYIFSFQNALFSEHGIDPKSGRRWDEYIDVDSLARKYLIDEAFSNFDGGKASQFFFLDDSEQKIYAGHCWDYDLTLGKYWATTWNTPYSLLAQRNWFNDTSWYYALCQQDAFMERVAAIYEAEFRPLLQHYLEEVIPAEASAIEGAVFSEYLRWPALYAELSWETSVSDMETYLREHIAFLDSLWLDNEDYCIITLQTSELENICVPRNTVCDALPQPSDLGSSGSWYDAGTGLPFDASQPITEDMVLVAIKTSDTAQSVLSKLLDARYLIVLASVAVLGLLMVSMMIIDILHRKGRRHSNERKGTKVSS